MHKGSYNPQYLGLIDSQNDLKPTGADDTWSAWPDLAMEEGEVLKEDTDQDGIPDEWESNNALNPNNASDAGMLDENGYSHLENYLETILAKPDPVIPEVQVALQQPSMNMELNILSNGTLNVIADEQVKSISLYDVKGMHIISSTGNSIQLPHEKALYILKVDFENGCSLTRKLLK